MQRPRLRQIVPLVLALLGGALIARAAEPLRLSSPSLQIGVDASNGQLVELIDRTTGHNFAPPPAATSTLWSLDLALASGPRSLGPADAKRCEIETLADPTRGLRLSWSDFSGYGVAGLRVEIVARPTEDPAVSRWELAVTKPRDSALEQVVFPRLAGLPAQSDERLAVPAWLGELLVNPREEMASQPGKSVRTEWQYPGRMAMQVLAFYRPGGAGLYLACDDPTALRKIFAANADGRGGFDLEVAHLPENGARGFERYAPPYGVRIGTFQGDWITAAERYRAWAVQQPWIKSSRRASGATPQWAQQTALWVWNRGRSSEVLEPAVAMQRELGLPVSVLWHWWHGCAYDAGFPEYLPPREGAELFRAALAKAHEHGVHTLVYMNSRLWGLTTRSWEEEGAIAWAVKRPDGSHRREIYNTFTRQPLTAMCMGTEFWRKKYAGIAERAIKELGVDGIYMDQACSSLSCFDATHGHPLGGGSYWMNGFRQLSADIRQRSADVRPIGLAGEGAGEAWLPYLDLMLSLEVSRERYRPPTPAWEPIPFFQAVYHPYALQFGNYSSLTMPPYDDLWPAEFAPKDPLALLDEKFALQFRFEQARAFVWGQQPMIANFRPSHLKDRPEEIAYVLRLARLRQAGLDYLMHGEFLRPPAINAADVEADISRLSIYAGQKGALTSFKKTLPLAIAGAWRAPDGDVGVALASIADQPQTLTLAFAPAYHGTAKAKRIVRIDESGRTPLGALSETGTLVVTLPARGACLVAFEQQ
jgi:hypothetical protein